jgi:hypothetical protein
MGCGETEHLGSRRSWQRKAVHFMMARMQTKQKGRSQGGDK